MEQYSDLLKNQILASFFALALILALAILLWMLNKKYFFNDLGKTGKIVVNLLVVAVVLLADVYFSVRILHLYQDIHQQAYVTYQGDFEVSSFKEGYVTLNNESGSFKLDGKVDLPGGTYSGTIVYARNSKYILEWNVD